MGDQAYEPAATIVPGKLNPVQQFGLWDILSSWFRVAFHVGRPIEELADRFRVELEDSWDQLDSVKAAYIRIGRASYALVRHRGSTAPGTEVWLIAGEDDADAESIFLRTFDLDAEDITWRAPAEEA